MEDAKKILLIGAGGHCLAVLDSLLSSYQYQDIGIIDKKIFVQNQTRTQRSRLWEFLLLEMTKI